MNTPKPAAVALPVAKLLLRAATISREAQHRAHETVAKARQQSFAGFELARFSPDRYAQDIGQIDGFSLCCEMAGDYHTAAQLHGLSLELRSALRSIEQIALTESLATIGVFPRKGAA